MDISKLEKNKVYIGFSRLKPNSLFNKFVYYSITFFSGGNVDHVFFLYYDYILGWCSVGALFSGLELLPIKQFLKDREIKYVFEPKYSGLLGILYINLQKIGTKYNYLAILGIALFLTFKKIKLFSKYYIKYFRRNFLSNPKELFCSQWVEKVILQWIKMLKDIKNIETSWSLSDIEPSLITPYMILQTIETSTLFSKFDIN